jgi:FAD/FMN-containing dehydrogenase
MGTPIDKSFEAHGIEIKTPLDPDWRFYSSTYNVCVPATPEIVILPATIEQVSQAVICASNLGLPIQARSGGHSYASHSSGGTDGSAVVDLRKLQDVELSSDGIVRVGGGVRLGSLASVIFEQGGRALAHGTCPAVGIGGHFTHGGFGMASRAWGLSMDQIVALDVITADGKLVRASKSENADLFYVSFDRRYAPARCPLENLTH